MTGFISEFSGLLVAVVVIYYVVCMILVPIAICRTCHWSHKCFQELRYLNDTLAREDRNREKRKTMDKI